MWNSAAAAAAAAAISRESCLGEIETVPLTVLQPPPQPPKKPTVTDGRSAYYSLQPTVRKIYTYTPESKPKISLFGRTAAAGVDGNVAESVVNLVNFDRHSGRAPVNGLGETPRKVSKTEKAENVTKACRKEQEAPEKEEEDTVIHTAEYIVPFMGAVDCWRSCNHSHNAL